MLTNENYRFMREMLVNVAQAQEHLTKLGFHWASYNEVSAKINEAKGDHGKAAALIIEELKEKAEVLKTLVTRDCGGQTGSSWCAGLAPNANWAKTLEVYEATLWKFDIAVLSKNTDDLNKAKDKLGQAAGAFGQECPDLGLVDIIDKVAATTTSYGLFQAFAKHKDKADTIALRKAVLAEMAKLSRTGESNPNRLAATLPAQLRVKVDAAIKMRII